MSEEKRIYEQILASLESYSSEIQRAFTDRAGDNGIINTENIGDLINDLSVIFDTDVEEAKAFFTFDNEDVAKYFDLDNISYDDFIELLKMWLQKKITDFQDVSPTNNQNHGNNILDKPINSADFKDEDDIAGSNTLIPPNNYKTNREALDELVIKHKDHLHVKFYQLQNPDVEAITLNDYFTFLQDSLALEGLVIYENNTDTQDLFSKEREEFSQKLTQVVNKYYDEVKGTRHTIGEEELLLTFNECFDLIDYWFQTDENVTLVNPKKKVQSQQPTNDVKALLLETIEKYNQMIKDAATDVEKKILQGTIDSLYHQLSQLEAGPKTQDDEAKLIQEAKLKKKREEKRMKALRDIFDFYSKQQLNAGKAPTFDRIEKQFSSINLGKLSVIIKNFQMKIDQFKLKETFNKVTKSEFVTFEEFCDLFKKVSKDAELIKDPKVVKPNYEKMKEYKPDSYKTSPVPKLGKIADLKKRGESEKRKTDAQKIDDMWDHMGLYDGTYKNNLTTVQLAFNSQDKETFRIPPDSLTYKLKIRAMEGKSPEEIKEAINQRNELRKAVRDVKLLEKSLLRNYRDSSVSGPKSSRRDVSISEKREDTYAVIMSNKPKATAPEKKLTFNQVQKYKQNEIKSIGAEDRFDPRDLIDDNDDEDNVYLAEYNIINDPKFNEQPIQEDSNELFEETSKIESNVRKTRSIPGKYSRMPVKSKTRIGTRPAHQIAEINTEKKPMTLNDIDYKNPVTASSNHSEYRRPQLGASQSVKHNLGVSKHLSSIHEYANTPTRNLDQSHHSVTRSIHVANGMSYEPSQFDPRRAVSNVVLSRAYQIQEEALRRENAIMTNLLSMQNNKMEKGLRIARK